MPPRFAANVSMLFREYAFLDRFDAAARMGFTATEFWWPAGQQLDDVNVAVHDAGVDVVLINFDGGDLAAGDRGLINDAEREGRFHENISEAIAFAVSVGCRQLNALVGIELPDVPRKAQLERVRTNLVHAARAVAPSGMRVLVEAINTHDNGPYLVSSTDEAAALVKAVAEPNIALQYDAFHMHRMGEDVETTLRRHIREIAHVQIADDPGRGEPATGEIDFERLFTTLDELGYAGHVGLEYAPTTTTEATLSSLAPWV